MFCLEENVNLKLIMRWLANLNIAFIVILGSHMNIVFITKSEGFCAHSTIPPLYTLLTL